MTEPRPTPTPDNWRARAIAQYEQTAARIAAAYERILQRLRAGASEFLIRLDSVDQLTVSEIQSLTEYQRMLLITETELREFAAILRNEAAIAQTAAIELGTTAARNLSLSAAGDLRLLVARGWIEPDPAALERLIGYVDSAAMRAKFAEFGENATQNLADAVIAGVALGQNPRAIARLIDNWYNVPRAWADNMARTAQIYAYRSASHAAYRANADIVEGWVWWATLDARTCISCISKHGTRYTLNETLNDHHRGRCVERPIVRGRSGWVDQIEQGRVWFDRQSRQLQNDIMGGAMYRAYRAGAVGWDQFSQSYQNDVYGEMLRAASLYEILGRTATRYYRR